MKRIASAIMLVALMFGMLTLVFNVQLAKASGTIYIRADGTVDPPGTPIQRDGSVYTFTDNISADSIVIEKDDVVIDGNDYMLNGSVSGIRGFDISYRNNVTVENTKITKFGDGIYVYHSNSCKVLDNIVTDCWYAIEVMHSSNNNTVSNNMVKNGYGGITIDYSSNDNTVANNTVKNSKYLGWGLYLWASSGNVFSGNIATNNSKGMDVKYAVDNTIHCNNISGNQRGVDLSYSSNNIISENNITANKESGVYLARCSNNVISGNTITNNTYQGIELYEVSLNNSVLENNITNSERGIWIHHYSDYNSISKNTVTNNEYGIALSESSNSNTISENNVTANNWHGISLYSFSNNNSFSGNDITNNGYGIVIYGSSNNSVFKNRITTNNNVGYLQYSSNNSISGNNITDNVNGMRLEYSSNNHVYHNNFINNTDQVYTYESLNTWDYDYRSGGNYWSDYTGSDANGDGIGDAPYVIDADNRDRYPLMHPWSPLPVHNVNTGLGYATIQEAINANETLNSHTIFVDTGTYYEHVVVNKSISLMAEDNSHTVIDGNGTGKVVLITANNVSISGIAIRYSGYGVYDAGIWITSNNNNISNNHISNNSWGISLEYATLNIIKDNIIDGSWHSEGSWGGGIVLWSSSNNNLILNNVISCREDNGIFLKGNENQIIGNTIMNYYFSAIHFDSGGNILYHNNFMEKELYIIYIAGTHIWDNGYPSGGNYWSDYSGVDVKSGPGQDLPGSDGIGDTPYIIDGDNVDHYPLMDLYVVSPPPTYALTITATVGGTTEPIPGTYSYTANSTVQVMAIPEANYLFDYWELDSINVGSANPYTVLMDLNHTLKPVFSPIPQLLSASINPLSASILVGQPITFTSTVSGGYAPYSYQWYLSDNPVSGATSNTWTFTPTLSGIYHVYLEVSDAKDNTAQSEITRMTVSTIPVGGYSFQINGYTAAKPLALYPTIVIILILTTVFTTLKRKTYKRTKP